MAQQLRAAADLGKLGGREVTGMAESKRQALGAWAAAIGAVRLAIGGVTMAAGYGWLAALLAGVGATPRWHDMGGLVVTVLGLACLVPRMIEPNATRAPGDVRPGLSTASTVALMTPFALIGLWSMGIDAMWQPTSAHDFGAVAAAVALSAAGAEVWRPRRGARRDRGPRATDIGEHRRDRTLTLNQAAGERRSS